MLIAYTFLKRTDYNVMFAIDFISNTIDIRIIFISIYPLN